MGQELLWKAFDLCGTQERQAFREAVCRFIRYHMLPRYILHQTDPEKRLLRVAADGVLCRDFSIERLCMLVQTDMLGRVALNTDKPLEKIALCHQAAQRMGCLLSPGAFADDYTQRAYFKDRNVWRTQSLFNDTWGEVVLLCELPGTGKDTWIRTNKSRLPAVSLDNLRREMGVSPVDVVFQKVATIEYCFFEVHFCKI